MADKFNESSTSDHAQLKIPAGDSPYVKAKHAQLVEKDPNKAVALFWCAINSTDRVDSALKDMAVVMKQLNRAEEAIEAIKSFRGLCSIKAQDPLDNVLLDLYKKCGRITEQIDLLNHKLRMIDEGAAFGGKIMKTARSQGKKFHVTVEQEKSRLLGNLAWAYMQCENYKEAEPLYRRALEIEKDYNKMCNLAICLMQTGSLAEAKILLADVRRPTDNCNGESYQKSFDRAREMMNELELKPNSLDSTLFSSSDEKTNTDHEASPDALTQGSSWRSSSQEVFFSPVSVKVSSNSKPLMISEYAVERGKMDSGTENLVIRLDIQRHKASKDQSLESSNTSTERFQKKEDEGARICFERPALSSGPNVNQYLFSKTEKKTWADMAKEDEQSVAENTEIGISSLKFVGRSWADIAEEEDKTEEMNFEFGSRTPTSSCKKLNKNEDQKWTLNSSNMKTAYQKYRSNEYKELSGRCRGMAKNDEHERRSLSSAKSCEDSYYLSRMKGRYSCEKLRNRLQVFQEITPSDAKA